MIEEVDAGYIFSDTVTLEGIEGYIRAIQDNRKLGAALIATALGRVKRDGLQYSVSSSFREYIEEERTGIKYREALRLAKIGENYWNFQPLLKENDVKVSENMTKILLLDKVIIENDPVFWRKFKELSTRQLAGYIKNKKATICGYPSKKIGGNISVSGGSIYFGEERVKGVNLNKIRAEMEQGKQPIVLFVENEAQARKVRRRLADVL